MNRSVTKVPIPWVHNSSPLVTSWVWETSHFILTIFAEGLNTKKMYNWKINDKSKGFPIPFDSAPAESFQSAVDTAIEIIAKSYSREYGYQAYAGELATTFTIANGAKLNFAPIVGIMVIVIAKNAAGEETSTTGIFTIQNYDFVIQTTENTGVIIPPERVINISEEYGSMNILESLQNSVKTSRNKRIFYQEWVKGCTGRPGFNANTTEHAPNDPFCSIHNI